MDSKSVISLIQAGKIGVIPTDTIYGLVCTAFNKKAVERLYIVRDRNEQKPCIVLISDISELGGFGITVDNKLRSALEGLWPGAVSIILDCPSEDFSYLHRGTKSLAFRLPANESLRALLRQTGPLLAPSANPEGKVPAQTIGEARTYFEDSVDFYLDGGKLVGTPSTLVRYENGSLTVLRQGAVRV